MIGLHYFEHQAVARAEKPNGENRNNRQTSRCKVKISTQTTTAMVGQPRRPWGKRSSQRQKSA